MSLYTPVFPPTDPPAEQTPSSSYSSVDAYNQQRRLSYSARLSQRHLAIATLPYELCPSSAPLSPGSQERSAKLQSDIEKAVREGRNITDFCKLRTTKLGWATKQPAHSSWEQGDDIPWILAETEEEWLEWERKVSVRRNQRKGKERANVAPSLASQSQNTHDKVLNWKAGLLSPSSSLVTALTASSAARSSLGFPVVKRSTMAKNAKSKCKLASSLAAISRTKHTLEYDGQQGPALRDESRVIGAVHVDVGGVERRNSSADSKQVSLNPPSESKGEPPIVKEVENIHHEIYDISAFPPPSFPSDLVTSTQKDTSEPIRALDIPRLSLPANHQGPILEHASNLDAIILANNNQESEMDKPIIFENNAADDLQTIEPPSREIPQPTPPSPPYSSETSQQPLEIQQSDVQSVADILRTPATPPRDQGRPLTPPPEAEKLAPVTPSRFSNTIHQSSPRTPERRPQRTLSKNNVLNVPRTTFPGSCDNLAFVNGHITPDAAINGANVARTAMALVPRTPERNGQILPDPLTTSRKSRPRPRPPSRKHSVQSMDVDSDAADNAANETGGGGGGGVADPSPAKSERSYFSSPASGSSSGSSAFSRGSMSMLFVPGSPTSPLGFTQNPSRFAPLGHSTQMSSSNYALKLPQPEPGSPTASRNHSRNQDQTHNNSQTTRNQSSNSSQKKIAGMRLGTNNSTNYYNSQFDVDTRVDQLSNFMRQDVDLDAWLCSSTDIGIGAKTEAGNEDEEDEEDVVAVEELTKVYHHTASSLSF